MVTNSEMASSAKLYIEHGYTTVKETSKTVGKQILLKVLKREVCYHQPCVPLTVHQIEHEHHPILRGVVQYNHSAPTMIQTLTESGRP